MYQFVGALEGVRVLDLVQTCLRRHRVAGRPLLSLNQINVTVAEHDVVGAGAAIDGLVEVVTHGVLVGEGLEVRYIARLNVVEAQRGSPFAGGRRRGSFIGEVVRGEVRRLGGVPLVPAPTVVSTHENSFESQPEGFSHEAWKMLQSSCCHIW